MNFFIQVDREGKPKLGSAVFHSKVVPNAGRLIDITDYLNPCCDTPALVPGFKKFYIRLDQRNIPLGGTVTNKKPKGKFADITTPYVLSLCCANGSTLLDLSLRTISGNDVDHYPVGVFDVNQNFIDVAATQADYVTIWNSNVNNQAKGTLFANPKSLTKFKLLRTAAPFTGNSALGMNYFVTSQSNSNAVVNVSTNTYVGTSSGLLFNSNSGSTVSSDSILNYNFSALNWHVTPAFSMQSLTLTGYVGGNGIYVFDNGQSNLVYTPDPFNPTLFLDGNLFTDIQHFSFRSDVSHVHNITGSIDWSKLTNLKSFVILNLGGGSFSLDSPDVPNNLAPSLLNLYLGDFAQPEAMYALTWLTASHYPNLHNLLLKGNASQNFATFNSTWWSNLPKVSQSLLIIGMTSAFALSAAVSDAIWNQLAINLFGIVPTGNHILQIQDSSAVTSASLAARTYLAGQGWTILLT